MKKIEYMKQVHGNNKYIIYSKTTKTESTSIYYTNFGASLSINLVDEDTGEKVYGGIIRISGREYVIDEENKMIFKDIGKEYIYVNFINIPEDYLYPDDEYRIIVPYREDYIENIKLTHKKGEISIKTNIANATYEIYSLEGKLLYTYKTNAKGEFYTDKINTGKYILKQKDTLNGYEKVDDTQFEIGYEEKTSIVLNHGKKEPSKEINVEDGTQNKLPNADDKKDENQNENEPKEENQTNIKGEWQDEVNNNVENTEKVSSQTGKYTQEISRLPRTGNDYFYTKLILSNIILFIILVMFIQKKQTAK